jgi:hypothetical protein
VLRTPACTVLRHLLAGGGHRRSRVSVDACTSPSVSKHRDPLSGCRVSGCGVPLRILVVVRSRPARRPHDGNERGLVSLLTSVLSSRTVSVVNPPVVMQLAGFGCRLKCHDAVDGDDMNCDEPGRRWFCFGHSQDPS